MLNWWARSYHRIRQQYHDITEGFSPDYMLVDLAVQSCAGEVLKSSDIIGLSLAHLAA